MNKRIWFPVFVFLGFLVAVYAASIGDSLNLIFTSGNTTINSTDICFSDGTCVSDVTGNLTDTNAETICVGVNVFLDGEGNCQSITNGTGGGGNSTTDILTVMDALRPGTNRTDANIISVIDSNRPGTNRTDADIISVMDSNRPGTNLTDAAITALGYIKTDTNTWNSSTDILTVVDALRPGTNRTDANIISVIDSNRPGTNLTKTDVRSYFNSSSNISYDSTTGAFWFNMTCEQITGSAALCDGDDAVGGGGGAGDKWVDLGTEIMPNSTYATDVFINGSITALNWENTSLYILFHYPYTNRTDADIISVVDANRPGTNRTDADITGLCYNTPAEIYSAVPMTNRTDADIVSVISTNLPPTNRTDANIISVMDANRPGTNLTDAAITGLGYIKTDTNTWNSTKDIQTAVNESNFNITINGLTIDFNGSHFIFH